MQDTGRSSPGHPADRHTGTRYLLAVLVGSVLLFGLLRLEPVEQRLLLPLTALQKQLADRLGGDPDAPVRVGLECSGADAIALCLAAVLAFPASWSRRLVGAVGGLLLIGALNVVRIASLSRSVHHHRVFELLHVYLWPAVLIVAVAGYVFVWMRHASRPGSKRPAARRLGGRLPWPRLAALTLVCSLLFVAAGSWYLRSPTLLRFADAVAWTAAWCLNALGVQARLDGNLISTAHGAYIVTQECVATPLIPLYLAVVLALPLGWLRRSLLLLLSVPLFFVVGVSRLLVLALPRNLVGDPSLAIHAFNQLALAAVLLLIAALWQTRRRGWGRGHALLRWLLALAMASLVGLLSGTWLTAALRALSRALLGPGSVPADAQAALALLPGFQLGLFLGLAWLLARQAARPLLIGVPVLLTQQLLLQLTLGWLWLTHSWEPHTRELRAWAVAAPLLLALLLAREPRQWRPAAPPADPADGGSSHTEVAARP